MGKKGIEWWALVFSLVVIFLFLLYIFATMIVERAPLAAWLGAIAGIGIGAGLMLLFYWLEAKIGV